MFLQILALPRNLKRVVAATADVLGISFALWFAVSIELHTLYLPSSLSAFTTWAAVVCGSVLLFYRFGLYRAMIRYLGAHALFSVCLGVFSSAVLLALMGFLLRGNVNINVVTNYGLVALLFVGGTRFFVRAYYRQLMTRQKSRVLIYGAGEAGRQLAQALINGAEFHPSGFLDDDKTLQGSVILGRAVYAPERVAELIEDHNAERVLLAIPSASRSTRKTILEQLEPLPVLVQTIPGMADVVTGDAKIDELQPVRIEDLLGRDPVTPNESLMQSNITDKTVMVTGAGGSIGSELCRQIVELKPKSLLLYELSEPALYYIHEELQQLAPELPIYPFVGSVQQRKTLKSVLQTHPVDTIYHAAAYKHVPMVEHNVVEGVRNNVFGTWYCAQAALNAGVEKFVLVSTDKAVRPTNVMGASKRMAELVLQGLANSGSKTSFCMVRFGNVLGSSGSVVPKFREQIESGGPVTLTHPDITRYFMTIPEAAQLVIQAGAMGDNGDVFVLDMGEPVRIYDLASKMVRLMGLTLRNDHNPDGDIEIKITGLRPGEKLYEELLIGENPERTEHERIRRAQEVSLSWQKTLNYIERLEKACLNMNGRDVREILQQAPTGFTPSSQCADLHHGLVVHSAVSAR